VVARVVIAAPASGHGKTTVATGLLAAFARRRMAVAPFKVGPDYIDPGYHALAAGRPGRNLDPVLVGEDLIGPLFAHGAQGADLAVIEGVMGLYDGRTGAGDTGSTAHVARLLDAPVILVVDAAAQGRSVAALVHGFRSFGNVRLGGVILNRVGSDRHEAILREACEEVGTPVLGALRRADAVAAPSRHLGLIPAAERRAEALASVEALAALIAEHLDLEAVLALARSAPPLAAAPWTPEAQDPVPGRPVVALAGGPAFSFSYAETAELLTGAGAEVVTVDPLRDEKLPPGTRGLVVGGGFPEVYAAELSANEPLRLAVASLAAVGRGGHPDHRPRVPPHHRASALGAAALPGGRRRVGVAGRRSGGLRHGERPGVLPASALGRAAVDRPAGGRRSRRPLSARWPRWYGDARQPVVQGRSFSGLRTAQMCLIRSPATSKANTVTVLPSC
jgi:cobyrinic acid a,c-diamide synthase